MAIAITVRVGRIPIQENTRVVNVPYNKCEQAVVIKNFE
jgi:hypothetical protein